MTKEEIKGQKFGAISYGTLNMNIGDDIQTMAAIRFLPHIDAYVYREKISKFRAKEKHKVIMNAWWMFAPFRFPPSKAINPLLVSMHFHKPYEKVLFRKKSVEYLKNHGPVGCRDWSSMEMCKEHGIDAYFSGCLTTTLEPNPKIKREEYILAVDVPNHIVEEIRKRTARPVVSISKNTVPLYAPQKRFEIAKIFLSVYHKAHAVITPNIHTALPSLAFQTPTLFYIPNKPRSDFKPRTDCFLDLFNCATQTEFLANCNIYDFDNPPKNPETYLKMKDKLIKQCTEFTGFNNENSLIDENGISTEEAFKFIEKHKATAKHTLLHIFGLIRNIIRWHV